ncbi:MAG: hypothetical protein EA426_10130 [Spirochaetaceae bacterium]|nr:MAG: hypothetical protein EA426_10130 [Spirochaetaceae bacterium]
MKNGLRIADQASTLQVIMQYRFAFIIAIFGAFALHDGLSTPAVSLRSNSGTPPVLQLTVSPQNGAVRTVTFETAVSGFRLELGTAEEFEFTVVPFVTPGVYDAVLELDTENETHVYEYRIGFVDFVWGRDNFSFSNDGELPTGTESFSEVFGPWAGMRFRPLTPAEQVLLLRSGYSFFRTTVGRCYAFSGGAVRYLVYPELLPHMYDSVYEIPRRDVVVQRQMDRLQNDIVFEYFVDRGVDLSQPQSRSALLGEIESIIEQIASGQPVVVSYIAPKRHHSLVAYGFIEDKSSEELILLVANNWNAEQDTNMYSDDAENLRVFLARDRSPPYVEWVGVPVPEYRYAERVMAVDVRKEYTHREELFELLLAEQREELISRRNETLIVENAAETLLVDSSGKKSGYVDGGVLDEIPGVRLLHYEGNHIYSLPRETDVSFTISGMPGRDDEETLRPASLFYLSPRTEQDDLVAIHRRLRFPDAGEIHGEVVGGLVTLLDFPPSTQSEETVTNLVKK